MRRLGIMIKHVWNSNDISKRHNLHILLIKRILMMSYAPAQPFPASVRPGRGGGKNQQKQNKMFTANNTKTSHHPTQLIIKL